MKAVQEENNKAFRRSAVEAAIGLTVSVCLSLHVDIDDESKDESDERCKYAGCKSGGGDVRKAIQFNFNTISIQLQLQFQFNFNSIQFNSINITFLKRAYKFVVELSEFYEGKKQKKGKKRKKTNKKNPMRN